MTSTFSGKGRSALLSALSRLTAADLLALPDSELLRRYLDGGDEAAFTALVRRHGKRVLAACRQVLGERADVEDAFQATFLVLLKKARGVRWRPDLGGWLFVVAHRTAVRLRTAAAARRRHEAKAAQGGESPAPPAPDLSWREAVAALHEELDRLAERYRQPLLLCYLEGLSRDEAAAQLGWSAGALKGRLERGRELLRQRLLRRGVTFSAGLMTVLAHSPAASGLPPRLITVTVRAATGGPSAPVAALVQGVSTTMTTHALKFIAAIAVVAGLLAGAAGLHGLGRADAAQDPPKAAAKAPDAPPAKAEDRTRLIAALADLESRKSLSFRGEVSVRQPQNGGPLGGVIVINGGAAAEPFTGGFDAMRTPGGEFVLASTKGLPGVSVYDDGKRRVVRATYEAGPIDAEAVANELPQLMDMVALQRHAGESKELKAKAQNGDTVFTLPLSKRVLRAADGGGPLAGLCKPEVQRLEARVVCTAGGKVKSLEFHVVRSDVTSCLMKLGADVKVQGGGANPKDVIDQLKKQLGDGKGEGPTTVYALTLTDGEPSARVQEFAQAIRKELQR